MPVDADRTFRRLLVNTLVSGVTSSFLWFALTFWVYLETRSVVATGVIGGAFSLSSAVLGPAFGTYVDRHRKHTAMVLATAIVDGRASPSPPSCSSPSTADDLLQLRNPWFWLLVGLTLLGSVAGQMRSIALSTCVTLLVPEDRRDRANGMVGTVTGVSFAITSVFSGLVIGQLGMGWAFYVSLAAHRSPRSLHLRDDPHRRARARTAEPRTAAPHIDVRGALEAIRAVPGLMLLILLAAFNNLLGGVFMALMDAYGLSLVSVETWGFLFGRHQPRRSSPAASSSPRSASAARRCASSCSATSSTGSSARCSRCARRSCCSTVGMFVWLRLIPVIEAAEQTVLQRSIPFERQGRVFGFAQLVENAAAPLTAFLIGPLAERGVHAVHDRRRAAPTGSAAGSAPAPSAAWR